MNVPLDKVGKWSELKLEIFEKYVRAYTTILGAKGRKLKYIYIDAFAGAGECISKKTAEIIPGSPLRALEVEEPFDEYHFIDLSQEKISYLKNIVHERFPQLVNRIRFYNQDCNQVLPEIFETIKWSEYKRALCFLDPYGLHLKWDVIEKAGKAGLDEGGRNIIEIFLNFPLMDMHRNIFWKNPANLYDAQIRRMDDFWGDNSWKNVTYTTQATLFGEEEVRLTSVMEPLKKAFIKRLKDIAGYRFVVEPLLVRMEIVGGPPLYYLFFATGNPTGYKIVKNIFDKIRERQLEYGL